VTAEVDDWYIAEADRAVGPLPLSDLRERLSSHSDGPDQWVWHPHFSDWRRAGDVAELWPSPAQAGRRRLPGLTGVDQIFRRAWSEITETPSDALAGKTVFAKSIYLGVLILAALSGIAVGTKVGEAFGLMVWVPIVCLSLAFLGVRATKVPQFLAPFVAVSAGLSLMLLLAAAVFFIVRFDRFWFFLTFADSLLLIALMLWMVMRRTKVSIAALMLAQFIGLLVNLYLAAAVGPSVSAGMIATTQLWAIGAGAYALASVPA
jgi:hypothetical protein